MWLGAEEAEAAHASLQGKSRKGRGDLERLLSEIVLLQVHPKCTSDVIRMHGLLRMPCRASHTRDGGQAGPPAVKDRPLAGAPCMHQLRHCFDIKPACRICSRSEPPADAQRCVACRPAPDLCRDPLAFIITCDEP